MSQMENQDEEREYHLLYKVTQCVTGKLGTKLRSFLDSTHYSVGSTDSDDVKNSLSPKLPKIRTWCFPNTEF